MLRQQEIIADRKPNRSLADFIAPRESGVPDYLGHVRGHRAASAPTSWCASSRPTTTTITRSWSRRIADRLAEAFAEYLHAQARKDWGYGAKRAADATKT